ncbi:MAG: phosphatase PAP2 family protein [Bacteroidia bacterium]
MVLISLIESLKSIDTSLLLWINSRHNGTLDVIMWNASARYTWLPLYIIMAFLVIRKFGKASWLPIIFAVLAIAMSDQFSNHFVKDIFLRYRPSHNLNIMGQLHYVTDPGNNNNYMGGMYGFVSSHAANTTAFTFFMSLLFRKKLVTICLICWVILVCYSRVYLGVHYPSDIAGGMLLGLITGGIAYMAYKMIKGRVLKRKMENETKL